MAPQTEKCLTCLKKFTNTDLAVQLICLDTSNNITVQNKLKACVPEVVNCFEEDELCTTCNYMLGICFKFRVSCLKSQEILMKDTARRPPPGLQQNNPFSIHLKISNQKSTPVPNCEFSFSTTERPIKPAPPNKSIVVKNSDSLGIVQTTQSKSGYVISVGQNNQAVKPVGKSNGKPPENIANSSKCYVRTQNGFVPMNDGPSKSTKYNLTLEDLLENSPSGGERANSMNKSLRGLTTDDRIEAIESDESITEQEKDRLLVQEIIKCNSHLKEYSAEQFDCHVELEPLPKFYVPKNQNDDKTGYLCQCNHCGLTFTSKVKLLSHIRRHFKYKPHKCSLCDRRYYEADDLKMHMMAHKVNDQKKLGQPATDSPPPSPLKETPERANKTRLNANLLNEVPPAKQAKRNVPETLKKPDPVETFGPNPLDLIPAINIKTESIFEELNTAPSVSKAPKVVKKPPPRIPNPPPKPAPKIPNPPPRILNQPPKISNPPTLQKRPFPTPPSRNDSVDFLEKYITNLRCRFCNLLFQTDAETVQHSKMHCNICFELCDNPSAHDNFHSVMLNKNKKKIYLCLVCGTHNPRGHFIIHNKVHDIVCEICSVAFTTDKMFQHHRQSCPEYHCKYCGKTFPTLSHGRTHEYHTHEKQYRLDMRCPQCKKQFPIPRILKAHSCKKCDVCGEFVDTKQTASHICAEQPLMEQMFDPLAQSLLDPLMQPLVESMYDQPAQFDQPEEPEDSKANIPLLIPMPTQGPIVCEVCSKSFDNKTLFNVHECYDEKGVRIYRCEICTGYFSRLEFIDHMKVHIS